MKRRALKAKTKSGWLRRTLLPSCLVLLAGGALVLGFLVYTISHPGAVTESVNPSHYLLPSLELQVPSSRGGSIPGWWIPGLRHAPGIILAPGHGMSRSDALSLAVALHQHGFNLLVVDQRGSGAAPRGASTLGLEETGEMADAVRFMIGRPENNPERMGIWGVDTSAFAALKSAAAFPEVRAVAADSAYETIEQFLGYRIAEEFGVDNRALRFGCWQLFRLLHIPDLRFLDRPLPVEELAGKSLLFIQGEGRRVLAASTADLHEKAPDGEFMTHPTGRVHAMSGEGLQDYDRQVAGFFHLNLQ